jgi:hypothetical protein
MDGWLLVGGGLSLMTRKGYPMVGFEFGKEVAEVGI